jgi:hypothetical protein
MNVLFVHGMGRSSFSWIATRIRFIISGINCSVFEYSVAKQDFSSIADDLLKLIPRVNFPVMRYWHILIQKSYNLT